MEKHTMPAIDSDGHRVNLELTVVDTEDELWAIEEPVEPTIVVTKEYGQWVVYSDDPEADIPGFGYREMRLFVHGDDDIIREEAIEYAKKWARACRGAWEML